MIFEEEDAHILRNIGINVAALIGVMGTLIAVSVAIA